MTLPPAADAIAQPLAPGRARTAAQLHEGGHAQSGGHAQVGPQQHSFALGPRPFAAQLQEGPQLGHPQVLFSLMVDLLRWGRAARLRGAPTVQTEQGGRTLHRAARRRDARVKRRLCR